jgi:putative Holliday junction resolvase
VAVVLGIDFGEKRVGVAVSDPEGLLALPLPVLDGSKERALLDAIADLAREREVERVVIGLPLRLDGTVGGRAEATLRFRDLLAARLSVPIETWDERLTSAAAERLLRLADGRESEKGGRPRRRASSLPKGEKGRVDRIAAVLILQSYLDHARREPSGPATEEGS